jgi:timeless
VRIALTPLLMALQLIYTTLKLLDANAKSCQEYATSDEKKKEKKKDKNKEAQDTITKMKVAAADFDVNSYFARRLVSNHTVFMYTKLLSQYASNSTQTNHRILAFLLRLSKYQIHVADPETQHHPLAAKTVTFEPILYSVQTLVVMDRILNDHSIRRDKKFEPLLAYCASFVHRFAKATQVNPLFFVEALFRHPIPHRFCDLSTNSYVSEELRMLAERDLLLEEQRRLEASGGCGAEEYSGDDDGDNDDSEEELEFEDFGVAAPLKPAAKRRRTVGKLIRGHAQSSEARSENSESETEAPTMSKAESLAKKRRVFDDESSDEEAEQEDGLAAAGSAPARAGEATVQSPRVDSAVETKSNRHVTHDESDSDEGESLGVGGGPKSRESSPRTAVTKPTDRIAVPDSSDSESSAATTSLQALLEDSSDDDN